MSMLSRFAVILALIGFGGFALQPIATIGMAFADEQEPDVASPAPEEDAEEATDEDIEGGEEKVEEGSEDPE